MTNFESFTVITYGHLTGSSMEEPIIDVGDQGDTFCGVKIKCSTEITSSLKKCDIKDIDDLLKDAQFPKESTHIGYDKCVKNGVICNSYKDNMEALGVTKINGKNDYSSVSCFHEIQCAHSDSLPVCPNSSFKNHNSLVDHTSALFNGKQTTPLSDTISHNSKSGSDFAVPDRGNWSVSKVKSAVVESFCEKQNVAGLPSNSSDISKSFETVTELFEEEQNEASVPSISLGKSESSTINCSQKQSQEVTNGLESAAATESIQNHNSILNSTQDILVQENDSESFKTASEGEDMEDEQLEGCQLTPQIDDCFKISEAEMDCSVTEEDSFVTQYEAAADATKYDNEMNGPQISNVNISGSRNILTSECDESEHILLEQNVVTVDESTPPGSDCKNMETYSCDVDDTRDIKISASMSVIEDASADSAGDAIICVEEANNKLKDKENISVDRPGRSKDSLIEIETGFTVILKNKSEQDNKHLKSTNNSEEKSNIKYAVKNNSEKLDNLILLEVECISDKSKLEQKDDQTALDLNTKVSYLRAENEVNISSICEVGDFYPCSSDPDGDFRPCSSDPNELSEVKNGKDDSCADMLVTPGNWKKDTSSNVQCKMSEISEKLASECETMDISNDLNVEENSIYLVGNSRKESFIPCENTKYTDVSSVDIKESVDMKETVDKVHEIQDASIDTRAGKLDEMTVDKIVRTEETDVNDEIMFTEVTGESKPIEYNVQTCPFKNLLHMPKLSFTEKVTSGSEEAKIVEDEIECLKELKTDKIVVDEIECLKELKTDNIVVDETEYLKESETDKIVVAETKYLKESKTDKIVVDETKYLKESETDKIVVAETECLKKSETDKIVLDETEYLKEPETDKIVAGETEYLKKSETDNIVVDETKSLKESETDKIVVDETEYLKEPETNKIAVGETKYLKESETDKIVVNETKYLKESMANKIVVGETEYLKESMTNKIVVGETEYVKESKTNKIVVGELEYLKKPETGKIVVDERVCLNLMDAITQVKPINAVETSADGVTDEQNENIALEQTLTADDEIMEINSNESVQKSESTIRCGRKRIQQEDISSAAKRSKLEHTVDKQESENFAGTASEVLDSDDVVIVAEVPVTKTKGEETTKPSDDSRVLLTSEALQNLILLRVRAFIKSQKQGNLDRLNLRTRGMQSASNLWKETARQLEMSVMKLTVANQNLEKCRTHSGAIKMKKKSIGVQVGEERMNLLGAAVNGTSNNKPQTALSSTVPSLPPSVLLNTPPQTHKTLTHQKIVTSPSNNSALKSPVLTTPPPASRTHTRPGRPVPLSASSNIPSTPPLRPSLTPQKRTLQLPSVRPSAATDSVVNLIDLTDDEDSTKKIVTQMSKSTPSQRGAHTVSKRMKTADSGNSIQHGSTVQRRTNILSSNNQLLTGRSPGTTNSRHQFVTINNSSASRSGEFLALAPGSRLGVSASPSVVTGQSYVSTNKRAYPQSAAQTTTVSSKTIPHSLPPSFHITNKHPAPLPSDLNDGCAPPTARIRPPKPELKISRVSQDIVLSWNMPSLQNVEKIISYQLFAYQESASITPQSSLWKKVGDVKALPLPMACTLTQFQEGNKYHFAVRAVDQYGRWGSYSDPGSIFLGAMT